MKVKYLDFINQTFDFPQEEFALQRDKLLFHGIPLTALIKKYGTPLKFFYLPIISRNIQRAKKWFGDAIASQNYNGSYFYCYCTKSSHFAFVLQEVLKNNVHLETSSAYDIPIIQTLEQKGKASKEQYVVCNGYKLPDYLDRIAELIHSGWKNTIPVLDNYQELDELQQRINSPFKIGIRIASEEEPKFEFYTSRLGIGYKSIVPFYKRRIMSSEHLELKMLHFFINTGIDDTAYYWNELTKCLKVYCELKKLCPELDSLNIGGGFPIKNSLSFEYDYEYITREIISHIKSTCVQEGVEEPHIFTEFGSYTVGESAGSLYSVIHQKKQNDREAWNMIDSSFMTTLPDSWAINKRFLMLPLNHWTREYERVLLGGLTCDSDDYYNSEQHVNAIYLPKFSPQDKLFIGFFHTGAYQETVGGFGGIHHCLTPTPRMVIIDKDENGRLKTKLFSRQQNAQATLKILGYT